MYLTFSEYQSMGGKLLEDDFTKLEMKARMEIDHYTFKRLAGETSVPNEVKECMFLLIELVEKMTLQLNSGDTSDTELPIKSQSNDGVSITYNSLDATDIYQLSKDKVSETIQKCLFKVKNSKGQFLTYRGLYPNE